MRKRTLSFVLMLALILSLVSGIAISAYAAPSGPEIYVENASIDVSKGIKTVTAELKIRNNPGFCAAVLEIGTAVDAPLTLTGIAKGALLPSEPVINVEAGQMDISEMKNITGDGVLATLTFTAKEDAVNGDYEIKASLPDGQIVGNLEEQEVAVSFVAGKITVTGGKAAAVLKVYEQNGDEGEKTLVKSYTQTQLEEIKDANASYFYQFYKNDELQKKDGENPVTVCVTIEALAADAGISFAAGDKVTANDLADPAKPFGSTATYELLQTQAYSFSGTAEAPVFAPAPAVLAFGEGKGGAAWNFRYGIAEADFKDPANSKNIAGKRLADGIDEIIFIHPAANPFTDINGHWAADAIQYAYANGLMSGVTDTLFDPDGTVTRAMVVTVLHNMENKPAAQAENPFSDVAADAWYTDAVLWAAENKIVEGADGKFTPTDAVTREQFATMLYRYASYKRQDVSKANDLGIYTDASGISDWALNAMQWANAMDLITGRTDTTLVPDGTATRAEMASIMMRFCEAK